MHIWVYMAVALGVLAGAGASLAQDLVPEPCHFDRSVQAWQGQVSCYRLEVPENRRGPISETIDLAIYELRARNDAGGEPVVYLAGGPGVGGAYYVNLLLRHPMRDDRPIIILEQRGIGASGELCPSVRRHYYRRVASRRNNDLRRRQFVGLIRNCFEDAESSGRDIHAYTTSENAADVAALRAALGRDQIDIWAVSYGTVLAQAYMRIEPDHVGAIVFDAPVPIDYALESSLAANFRTVLETRWNDCLAAGACDATGPSFVERLEQIIPEYNQRPLRMLGFSPEPGVVVNFVYVTGVDAAGIVFSLLYDRPTFDAIDRVLTLLERKSSSFLRAHYQRLAIPGFSFGMHYAVNCRGPVPDNEVMAELREDDPLLFGALQVGLQQELCTNTDLIASEPGANAPVRHEGRMLIMSGQFDPITPLSMSAPLRERFPNAGFLELRGGGHGPSRSLPCAQETVRRYFADPAAPVLDICSLPEGE